MNRLASGSEAIRATPAVTVTNPSTGVYAVSYVATKAGRWRAVGTAAGNGCDGVEEQFYAITPQKRIEHRLVRRITEQPLS